MTNQNIAHSEQLIPVFNAKIGTVVTQACDAADLHQFLQVATRFNDWITTRIAKYEFIENQDFILITENSVIKTGRGGDRRSKDYHLTLDMAKELAMVENNAKGRAVRRYFIECERRLHEQVLSSIHKNDVDSTQGQVLSQNFASELLTIADAIRVLVDKYASHATSEPAPNSLTCQHIVNCEQRTQPQLLKPTASPLAITSQAPPCADSIFLTVLRESLAGIPHHHQS